MLRKLLAISIVGGIMVWLVLVFLGNVFGPSIQLDDIKDVIVGDKIIISGTARNIDDGYDANLILKGGGINTSYNIEIYGGLEDKTLWKGSTWTLEDGYTLTLENVYVTKNFWGTVVDAGMKLKLNNSIPFQIKEAGCDAWFGDCVDDRRSSSGSGIIYLDSGYYRFTITEEPNVVKELFFSTEIPKNNLFLTIRKERKVIYNGMGLQKTVSIKNGKFNTFFDSSGLDGGLYQVEVFSWKNSVNKSFNLILANIEDVSIIRSSDIFGTPTTVVVSMKNPSNENKKFNLNLWLDDALSQKTEVSIAPNSFETVKFNLNNLGVGIHKINIGGHEKLIEVKPVPLIKLDKISGDIGIGRDLTITGTSNRPDGTSVLITIKNADSELARQTTTINNGRFSSTISTSNAKEGIYTVKADDLSGASDSTPITFIKLKADLTVIGMSVNPSELIVGDSATITATVKNNGNIEGSRNVELKVDGLVRKSKSIQIQPNSIKEVQFTVQEDVGIHNIEIEGYTKSLTFKVKPVIQLNKIYNVRVGQDLTISGITNMPDDTKILVTAKSGDVSLTPQTIIVKDGSFSTIFTTGNAKEGIYTIKAEDSKGIYDTTSVLISTEIPELNYDLSVSPKDVTPDGTVTASITIKNNVDVVKDVVLNLKVDDQIRQSQTVSIPPNSIKVVSFDIKNEKVGSHIIDINGYVTSYSVSAPAPITVTDISTNELRIQLRSDKTIISKNENIFLTLSAVNKITNTKDVHLQVILVIPSGLSATETSFAKSGVGQYVSDSIIRSGESKTEFINVGVMPNQIGIFTITGEVVYYLGDDKNNGGTQKISLPITVIG